MTFSQRGLCLRSIGSGLRKGQDDASAHSGVFGLAICEPNRPNKPVPRLPLVSLFALVSPDASRLPHVASRLPFHVLPPCPSSRASRLPPSIASRPCRLPSRLQQSILRPQQQRFMVVLPSGKAQPSPWSATQKQRTEISTDPRLTSSPCSIPRTLWFFPMTRALFTTASV